MDKLKCKICGKSFKNLISHISQRHSMTGEDYKNEFGNQPLLLVSNETRLKLSKSQKKRFENPSERNKNSQSQKNGASVFTTKYWIHRHGMSMVEAIEKVKEIQTKNAIKSSKSFSSDRSCFSVDYWVYHKNMTLDEANIQVSKLQSQLSSRSSKFKGKVRTVDERYRISKSMKNHIEKVGHCKWASHFGEFNGTSKLEVGVFEFIKNHICESVEHGVIIDKYIVDIICNKKIIEIYGDFWHANPKKYKAHDIINETIMNITAEQKWCHDEKRINDLKSLGYETLIVWETDWIKNKEQTIETIKQYLT